MRKDHDRGNKGGGEGGGGEKQKQLMSFFL